jgi:hypothetical protein
MNSGTCLCGTLRYEVSGPYLWMAHCNCSMCRKHHGAAFATFVTAPLASFRWVSGEGNVGSYQSSPQARRHHCRTCGSVAPTLLPDAGIAMVPAGNLDGELGIRPQAHIFVASKAPWYEITDALPEHAEYPPKVAAAAVPRPHVVPLPGITVGSCLCGEVAYEAEGEALRMYHCHCRRCRLARSAAHATNVFYRLDHFRCVRGEDHIADYKLPEAKYFGAAFCRKCGGEAPRVSRERGVVVVPAGTLDTDPGMRPQAHIYVGSKASWFEVTGSTPRYEEGPPPA